MRSNGRASKVPSQRSPRPVISATRRAETICRFLPRRLPTVSSSGLLRRLRRGSRRSSLRRCGVAALRRCGVACSLETAAGIDSLAPARLALKGLPAAHLPKQPRSYALPSARAFNQASGQRRGEACRRHDPPSQWGTAPLLGREVPFKNQQMLFSGLHRI